MRALCPSCREETGEPAERDVADTGGVEVTFVCPECDHRWRVTF